MSSKGRKKDRHRVMYNQSIRGPRVSIVNIPDHPITKYVKKARAWVTTTVTKDERGTIKYQQEWSTEDPRLK